MIPNVTIIILNWNGWEDTLDCLKSLKQIEYPNFNIVIVDNASEDESIAKINEQIKNDKSIDFTLIKNKKNNGFAEGNNIGIRYAIKSKNPDYILLLNNDTVVDKNFLNELVKVAEENINAGSVQSILLKHEDKIIDSLGQELTTWSAKDIGMDSEYVKLYDNREIFGACAAAALYRAKVMEDIGFFDKDFFLIYEDVDLSWRIRLKGYQSFLAVNSIVYHKRNISETISKFDFNWIKSKSKYHLTKNMLILAIRYHPANFLFKPNYFIKFLITFILCYYYSFKEGKFKKTSKILTKSLDIRREFKKNPLLENLQKQWIIK
jgi:GT2 family glycosyltransferase